MMLLFKNILLPFLVAFFLVLLSTPSYIKIAISKRLFDMPGEGRKLHHKVVPSMGGIVLFAAIFISLFIWYPIIEIGILKYLLPSAFILFFIGAKDDIFSTAATKKLLAHFATAFIMVEMAGVKISSLHGLFGIYQIPEWGSIALSIFVFIVIVNAYNLIDGVDGLAGGIGLIASLMFGIWFYMVGNEVFTVLAFSISGAMLAFLWFNFYPAKIFMGDSGSLIMGLFFATMAIEMIEFKPSMIPKDIVNISNPVLAMAILVYPLFDTLRVFTIRTLKGHSPFVADNNHIHHRLLKIGLSQRVTVLYIYLVNIIVVAAVVLLKNLDKNILFVVSFSLAILLLLFPFLMKEKKQLD